VQEVLRGRSEALEQRQLDIRSLLAVREKGRAGPPSETSASLAEDFAAGLLTSGRELRQLVARSYGGPVISLYLNLAPERLVGKPPVYLSVLNSMRHGELQARRELVKGLRTRQRNQLLDDLDEIEAFVGAMDLSGIRSLVLFKSGRDLNRVIRLQVRSVDRLVIDPDPYVEPLLALLQEQPQVLVIEVSKQQSRFWKYHLGHFEQVTSIESFVPTDTVDASRPGKVQRHRLTHLRWHLKATAQLAGRLVLERDFDLVVLAGLEEVVAELEELLPAQVQGRVTARLRVPAPDGGRELLREVEEVVARRRREDEEAALERLGEYQARGELACGLPEVLEVANEFVVRRLYVSNRLQQPGWICREHHYLAVGEGVCPFDGEPLLGVEDLVDELIEMARLHGVELMVVTERPDLLDPCGGVAAVTYAPLAALAQQ
jgi:hypothetical protein